MAMNSAKKLADAIKEGIGQGSEKTSKQTIGLAEAIIDAIQKTSVVLIPPGGVQGTAPSSGGSLIGGQAVGGKIIGPAGPLFASTMQLKMGLPSVTPQLLQLGNAIATHLTTVAQVIFDPGNVVGPCTNSPVSPGALVGAATKGKIISLIPDLLATAIASGLGGPVTKEVKGKSKAITDYIQKEAEVLIPSAGITAVCSAGGGPILLGAGLGGRVL